MEAACPESLRCRKNSLKFSDFWKGSCIIWKIFCYEIKGLHTSTKMCRYCTKKYFPQRSRIEASHVGRPRHFGSLFLHITLNSVWTLHTIHSACKIYQERQSIHPDQMPSHQTGWSWSSAALTFLLGSVEINMVHIWSIYESTFKFIWSEHLIIACMATVTWGQALRSQLHALHLLHAFNCLFQHFREWNYSHKDIKMQ